MSLHPIISNLLAAQNFRENFAREWHFPLERHYSDATKLDPERLRP
jgi:hypothetical protein